MIVQENEFRGEKVAIDRFLGFEEYLPSAPETEL